VRLVDSATGGILDAVTVRAEYRADVIDALDRLGRRLRRHLGESMLYVATHAVPLPRVTTPSLDALKLFAEGSRAFQENRLQEAEAEWSGAVAIDSTFASALAALGGLYYWTNRQALGDAYFGRALAHLGSLPERDRVLVRARAASWRGDRDSSTRLLTIYLDTHPDDIDALGMLAYDYVRLRRSADAVDVLSRLAALDSTSHVTFINLATAEKQLGRYRGAITHYRRAFALMPSLEAGNNNLNLEYGATFVSLGQPDSAAAVFSEMLKGDAFTRARGLRSLAFLAMYRGHYADACADLGEALTLLPAGTAAVSIVRDRLLLAAALGQRGEDGAAGAQVDSAYALTTRMDAEPTLLFWVGKALAREGEVDRAEALRERMRTRVHEGSATDQAASEGLEGEVLVARNRAGEAVSHLAAALHADSTNFALESLANAVASAGETDRADTLYRALARGQEFGWEGQEYWHLAEYQVGRLEELGGHTRDAVGAYERFLALWQEGDPDLPVVADARSRLSRLRLEEPAR
jgi:tetratricopeptide (TPR) repeat protein